MDQKRIKLPFNFKKPVLALGSHTKNTVCLINGTFARISRIYPDLSIPEDRDEFEKTVRILLRNKPAIVAYDMHPGYFSSIFASSLRNPSFRTLAVQHHHAHIAACMAENNLTDRKVIGVAFDGTGLGGDGSATLWGAEIFYPCGYRGYNRIAHLKEIRLGGGEAAIREPWRVGAMWLYGAYKDGFLRLNIDFSKKLDKRRWLVLKEMCGAGINSPAASSMGRLFDAVASIVLARYNAEFEAGLAIALERLATGYSSPAASYRFNIKRENGAFTIDPLPMFKEIVCDLRAKAPAEEIAFRFHLTVVNMVSKTCLLIRDRYKNNNVVLSGGVFQNELLSGLTRDSLIKEGFNVFIHKILSPNDSCVSLGQAAVAGFRTLAE